MRWTEQELEDFLKRSGKTTRKPPPAKKKNKYGARKTWVDGICFDSQKEADYYATLKLLVSVGEIDGFLYHGKMVCTEGVGIEQRAALYEPDFVLFKADGSYRIIDTKGVITDVFKLKQKSLLEKYPNIKVEII